MTIDWFTFTAQILNFLILVWLLKRFLYAPIVDAIGQRESRIADRLTEAAHAKETAERTNRRFQEKLDEITSAQEQLQAAAGREVDVWRSEHLRKAKCDVETTRLEWHRGLTREKQSLIEQLQLDGARHAVDISRHLLGQLADERLESRLTSQFLRHLADADQQTLDALSSLHHERTVLVETSLEMRDTDRDLIAAAIRGITQSDVDIEFRRNADLVCGIELRAPGCKLAWSIRESLAELESDLIDSIDQAIPSAVMEPATIAGSAPDTSTRISAPGRETAE
jgi:F-type H+-transporting ATPase subunit b